MAVLTKPRRRAESSADVAFATDLQAQKRRAEWLHRAKVGGTVLALLVIVVLLLLGLRIDPSYVVNNASFILQGLLTTIGISLASIFFASILALLGALGRLSSNAIAQGVSGFYISLIRGTPLLVQIFIIYNGLPQIGQQIGTLGYPALGKALILSATASGILALSLNYGAYMTEIFRGGIQAVSHGQWQAASALGLNTSQTMRLIILPQAFRTMIPAIGNQFIAMQKDSSLVSVMGIWEITYRASKYARKDSKFMEMFLLAAAIYWVLTIISEWGQSRLEAYMAQSEKR